jgi:hypothetical protein
VPRPLSALCGLVCVAAVAGAQSGTATEGALELLFPAGARALAMGQAASATAAPSEAFWWNPALIARGARQGALHFSQTIATIDSGGDLSFTFILPVQRVGAFALTGRRISYGVQELTRRNDGTVIGEFSNSVNIVGATFAPTFGDRVNAGLTYKLLQVAFVCSGECLETPSKSQPTSAFDFGASYRARKDSSVNVGVSLRNLGLPLQIRDAPQADPLPGRVDIGVSVSPRLTQLPPEATVLAAADIVNRIELRLRPGYRFGTELSWKNQVQLRAGYVVNGPPTGHNTGSLGAGYTAKQLQVDFAALINVSESGTTPPIFLSVRYRF